VKSYLKEPRLENPHLLLMARSELRPCLLQVPGVCTHAPGAEVWCCACHGNAAEYNKGLGMKAHDFFSVWGCARAHNWLDSSYVASGEERQQAFREALPRQIVQWAKMLEPFACGAKDRKACEWALQHLFERGYARVEHGLYLPFTPWTRDARIQKTA
jgi:hypothetical protein